MLQSTSEYEERSFDDIQRALDIEHTVKALEAQLCYDQHSPEEVARQMPIGVVLSKLIWT